MSKYGEFKMDIKGSEYTIVYCSLINNNSNYYGLTSVKDKQIAIADFGDIDEQQNTVLHELMHAVFYECGQTKLSDDENLIEFFEQVFKYIYQKFSVICKKFKIEQPQNNKKGR